jgi:amino acid transporter
VVPWIWKTSMSQNWSDALLFICVVAQFFCLTASTTSASRMMFAFSRDGAIPGHRFWRRLNSQRVPVYSIWAIAILAFLLAFPAYFSKGIGVGAGYIAYAAVTSIATIGLYIAYGIPIWLRLRQGDAWEAGEWNLGKRYKLVGWIAVLWIAFIAVLFILPITPTGIPFKDGFTWLSFNYAPVALIGTFLLVGAWWLLSARKWFEGPIPQGNEEELARIEESFEGQAKPAPAAAS